MEGFLTLKLIVPIVIVVLSVTKFSESSPLPPHHFESAFRDIRKMRLLPHNSVVLGTVPSIQVTAFKVDDYSGRGLNLRNLLGYDIPEDVIQKLETRVRTIRF